MSSTQSTPPSSPVFPVTKVASPLLFGSLFTSLSFGILLIQIYVYRACFPRDSLIMKSLVYFVFLVILVCTCLNASDMYYWFGSGFGDSGRLVNPKYSIVYTPLLGALIATLVQLFFCYRIFVIKRSVWPISLLISMIAMVQCAAGVGGGTLALIEPHRVQGRLSSTLTYLWLVSGAAADITIAVMMTYLLLRVSTAAHPSTRDVVKDVVTLIIETNTFSAIVAILSLGLFFGSGTQYYFPCPAMVLPGIYANSLLATLNNRAIMSNKRNSTHFSAETVTALQSGFSAKQITGPPLTRKSTAASIPAMSSALGPEEVHERGLRSIAPREDFRECAHVRSSLGSRSSVQPNNSRDTDEVARLEDDESTFVIC